jgi:hypothetical protein
VVTRVLAGRPRPHWAAALVACAVLGFFAYVRGTRVPLLSLADLGFHELGHLVMYVLPISDFLTAIMGSVMQVAVPLGFAAYFGWWRRDLPSVAVCAAWAATNLHDVSVYVADAPYERLPLLGGEHDWAYLLGPEQLDHLHAAHNVAAVVNGVGLVALLLALGTCIYALLTTNVRSSASTPVVATRTTPDDHWPTTSRTPFADRPHRNTRW